MNQERVCRQCGTVYRNAEKYCAVCGTATAPAQQAPPPVYQEQPVYQQPVYQEQQAPPPGCVYNPGYAPPPPPPPVKKSRKGLIALASVLGCLLIAGIAAAWQMEWGPFHINLRGIAAVPLEQLENGIAPPTDKERAQFASFVQSLANRSESKLTKDEKDANKAIMELLDVMAGGGFSNTASSAPAQTPVDFTALRQALTGADTFPKGLTGNYRGASYSLLGAEITTEPPAAGDPAAMLRGMLDEVIGAAENAEVPAPRAPHSNWPSLKAPAPADGSIICDRCKHKNPPGAGVCEDCGTLLAHQGLSAAIPEQETPILDQVPDDVRPEYDASVLNTIAGELYIQGYFRLPLLLSCLASVENPNSDAAVCTIANLLMTAGELGNALACADYGLKLNGASESLLYTAGMICMKMDEVDRAAAYFSRCLAVTGGGGLANQGMMMVALARQDFGGAFLYMLEGARDCYSSNVTDVLKRFKLRLDYKELSGKIFDQYTLMELMNFTRNRTAFDPSLDTVGQQLYLDRMVLPSAIADWHASGPDMLLDCVATMQGYAMLLAEDAKMVAEIYNMFSNATDLESLYNNFLGTSFAPSPKSELEKMISFEQEVFWLTILNDYFDWEIEKIEAKRDETMAASEYKDVMDIIDEQLKKSGDKIESFEEMGEIAALIASLEYFQETVLMNHSGIFTREQSNIIIPRIDGALRDFSAATNTAYEATRVLCEEYWCYSNAILGLISDDTIYNEWRQKQRHQVILGTGLYVMEAGMWAGTVCFTYGIIPMLGQGSIGGSVTSYIPPAPVLPITGKGATPHALMYGDIYVPNIAKVTQQVLGMDTDAIEQSVGKEIDWETFREGHEDFERWYAGLSAFEQQRWTAYRADPTLVRAAFVIDSTGKIGVNYTPTPHGIEEMAAQYGGISAAPAEESWLPGEPMPAPKDFVGTYGVATVTVDTKTGTYGLNVYGAGIERQPEAVTVSVHPSLYVPGFEVPISSGSNLTVGNMVGINGGVYAVFDPKTGECTSGGVKAGAEARVGNLIGAYAGIDSSVATGLTDVEIGIIFAGRKIAAKW